jgi:hypothetical protein
MAKDVIDDFEAGLEYAAAECLTKMKRRGEESLYLVKCVSFLPKTLSC